MNPSTIFSPERRSQRHPESQSGATLVEMLVAVGISILVVSIVTTSMAQFLLVTRWGNDTLRVTNALQTAALWLGRDALESHSFTPGSGTEYGTLSWDDASQQFRYSYDPLQNTLVREHLVNGSVQSNLNVARLIAQQSDVTLQLTDQLLTAHLTATHGDVTKTIQLDLALRAR